jgi:diguanylate cyclase (GGDEF)-like protein/PAS domain S-box-containing protein
MNPIARQPTSRTVINYTFAGAAFGGLFPLGAWILDALTYDAAWSLATIWRLHLTNPLHWIIDSAPFVLGVFAYQIGRRKQAEKTWRENEERYRSVFEDSPISLWEEDFSGVKAYLDRLRQGGVTDFREYFEKHPEAVTHCGTLVKVGDVNTATLTLYGARSKGDLLNNLERVFTPESYPIFREELISIAEGKTVFAHEGVNRTLQGETLHISLRWSIAPGYEATFARVLVSLIDITERKQAEEALRESELRFRNLFENSPDAVFVEDFEGKVLDANAAACHLNGMAYADLVGTNVLELIPADKREGTARDFSKMVKGELEYLEGFSQTKEGRVVPVEIRVSRITYSDKPALLLQVRDISTRKRAEAALQEAEGKYRSLVEQMPAAVYVWELGEGGACLYVSPQIEKMLGFPMSEWLADPDRFFRQVHPDDRAHAIAAEAHSRATGEPLYSEFRMLARDGRVVWVRDQSVVLHDETGQPRFNQGILLDITESKHAEEALQIANEKLILGMAELEQRSHEIALLNQMGDLLQTCLNAEEAYAVIGQSARQLFPDEAGALYMISASRDVVEAVAVWGQSPFGSAQDKPAEVLECVFAPQDCWALRRSRPHLVEDTGTGPLCRHLANPLPAAYLCIPMVAQSEASGVLYLQNKDGPADAAPPRLTLAKQQLAQTVADSVALALANLKLRETLRHQSIRDPLTGLFNRRYMEETLERETRRVARAQRPLGIIMLDVDRFKLFNDTFGHDAGDTLLRELGNFLRAHIRGEDVACRYGGEEFMLILPEASLAVTRERAEHLRDDIKHLHAQYHDQPLGAVMLSLGVAVFPDHGSTGEAVLKAADAALYRAKREGRDRVVVAG